MTIAVSLVIGILGTLLVLKLTPSSQETFTASGLVNLLFSVALSAAAIVLSISAIYLGKSSERAIVLRSDESIRLQSEIFTKTIDTLRRIESSTEVTEKRIEDIIAGRAGAIAERLVEDRLVRPKSRADLAENVKASVLEGLKSAENQVDVAEVKQRRRAYQQAHRKFNAFSEKVLATVAAKEYTHALKLGSGDWAGEGYDLVDAVFKVDGETVALCTLSTNDALGQIDYLNEFLSNIADELAKETFGKVVLAFDSSLTPDSDIGKLLQEFKKVTKEPLWERIVVLEGDPEEVSEKFDKIFKTKT